MATNKEKFLKLVSKDTTNTLGRARESRSRRLAERASQKVAILILKRLSELGWSQKDLARCMNISDQMVSKMVSGKCNFTFDTMYKIEDAIGISLFEIKSIKSTNVINMEPITLVKNYQLIAKAKATSEINSFSAVSKKYNSPISIPQIYE